MKILRTKLFSEHKDISSDGTERSRKVKGLSGAALAIGGTVALSTVKPSRLTGKVVRYHNTDLENVNKIMEEGLKTVHSEDPNNLTNLALKNKIPADKKKGLIYTTKRKFIANGCGAQRSFLNGKLLGHNRDKNVSRKILREWINPKHSKTLTLVFDYDKDIKGSRHIENPEVLYNNKHSKLAKSVMLENGTHIFDHDIDPSHIKGSKHFKKHTFEDFKRYVKNNPKRFGKEAAKVAAGTAAVVGGTTYAYKKLKKDKK